LDWTFGSLHKTSLLSSLPSRLLIVRHPFSTWVDLSGGRWVVTDRWSWSTGLATHLLLKNVAVLQQSTWSTRARAEKKGKDGERHYHIHIARNKDMDYTGN
jgi:hypothetical protein